MPETNVSIILEYYKTTRLKLLSPRETGFKSESRNTANTWMHPSLWQRWLQMKRDPRYSRVRDYGYPRIKGMVIHESLSLFKDRDLPFLHLRIGDSYKPALLWYTMRYRAYQSIIECCENMAAGDFPQINFYYEKLVCEALECLESHLSHLFNQIVPRLERHQMLEDIVNHYMHFLQEEDHTVDIQDLTIYFKPDWVQIDPEFIYLTDFKSSNFHNNSIYFEKQRLQLIIYAYLLEICYFPKKVALITIHFLGNNRIWQVPFTLALREEAQDVIRNYCLSRGFNVPKTGSLKSFNQTEEIGEKKAILTKLDDFF